MIKYKVQTLEKKSTSKGAIIEATLIDFNGIEVSKVAIFSDFPNFSSITFGTEVIGDIKVKQNGQYENKYLVPERTNGWGGGKRAPSVNMGKIMEQKAENIKEAQERKNDSISFFNATNSAIAIVVKEASLDFPEDVQKKIVFWRDWFLSEWHKYEADPNKGKQPF